MLYDTLNALPAAILFSVVMSITPGPNNVMLLASGLSFGFRRTLPQVLGISAGVALLMLTIGLGLGQAFQRLPILYTVLESASILYLLYLAWKIGTSGQVQLKKGPARPMRFHEAMAFQWINPKAWMMVLTAVTTVQVSKDFNTNALMMTAVLCVMGLPCIALWAGFGTGMRRLLSKPHWIRTFNIAMAIMLIATLYPMVLKLL